MKVTLIAAISLAATACSLQSAPKHTVTLSFPAVGSGAAAARSALHGGGLTSALTSLDPFDCFGVLVTGAGVTGDPRMMCAATDPDIGVVGGLVTRAGGELELSVPAGPARVVHVFAVKSTVGCPSVDALLNQPAATRFQGIDTPYEIGTATIDLFADASVSVNAHYDASSRHMFASCGVGSSTPATRPTQLAALQLVSAQGSAAPGTCNSATGRPCLRAKVAIGTFGNSGSAAVAPAPSNHPVRIETGDVRFVKGN